MLPPYLPPPPEHVNYVFTEKDSLEAYNHYFQLQKKRYIIAVNKKMFSPDESLASKIEGCKEYNNLLKSKTNKCKIKKVNLNYLKKTKDSLMYYDEEFALRPDRGFNEIDIRFNFSRIIFDDKLEKAILIVGVGFEKLNAFSVLLYFEKDNFEWIKKCTKTLEIS
jgi:hypothetical protein